MARGMINPNNPPSKEHVKEWEVQALTRFLLRDEEKIKELARAEAKRLTA